MPGEGDNTGRAFMPLIKTVLLITSLKKELDKYVHPANNRVQIQSAMETNQGHYEMWK